MRFSYRLQMNLRKINVVRYVTPLREGGSLPAIVEADDDGMYVLKFRGAGQGPKALVAEWIAGEIGRALGLPVPEIVLMVLDPELSRTEPDPEIQSLIKASAGLNLALDYLPGAITFDPVAEKPDAELAARIVWFDAFVTNIDRTARNTNLLVWHRQLHLIDHGAALYFHHSWNNYLERSGDPFTAVKDHVLLQFAGDVRAADAALAPRVTEALIRDIVSAVPDDWLDADDRFASIAEMRAAYVEYLLRRIEQSHAFVEEAVRARSLLV
jgi:hypothetical protein